MTTLAFASRLASRIPSAAFPIALLLLTAGCGDDGTTTVEPPGPRYRLVSLEPLSAGTAFPIVMRLAINEAGQVAGAVANADGTTEAALWSAGAVTSLGVAGVALDINDDGTLVGASEGDAFAWRRDGEVTRLPEPPDGLSDSFAAAVNESGTFAGSRLRCSRGCAGSAFVARGADAADLGTAGAPASIARDIGANGIVVGELDTDRGANQRAFSWQDGVFTFLTPPTVFSRANAINAAGAVVGMAAVDGGTHAVVWRGGEATDLGTLPELYVSEALAINDRDQIVGISFRPEGNDANRAFLHQDGRITDLNDLVAPSDWILERATDINDSGQIVAVARHATSGARAAFLLDPIP